MEKACAFFQDEEKGTTGCKSRAKFSCSGTLTNQQPQDSVPDFLYEWMSSLITHFAYISFFFFFKVLHSSKIHFPVNLVSLN